MKFLIVLMCLLIPFQAFSTDCSMREHYAELRLRNLKHDFLVVLNERIEWMEHQINFEECDQEIRKNYIGARSELEIIKHIFIYLCDDL